MSISRRITRAMTDRDPRVLDVLSKHQVSSVRKAVAGNPNTPLEILARLSRDWMSNVREAVAGNPNAPVEALARLSRADDERTRNIVSGNPKWKALQGSDILDTARYVERWLLSEVDK